MNAEGIPVQHVAKLARLELTDEEAELFQKQLQDIVGYIEHIKDLDLSDVDVAGAAISGDGPLRDDVPVEGIGAEKFLQNAPASVRGQLLVPRVLDAS